MKNTKVIKNLYSIAILLLCFTFLPHISPGQEDVKKAKIKIVKEKNGKGVVLDTTLLLKDLSDLENLEEIEDLLNAEGIEDIDIDVDVDGLVDISVDILEMENGEIDHVTVLKKKYHDESDADDVHVLIMKSDVSKDGKKMKVMVQDGQYDYLISEDDEDLTWVGDDHVDVEIFEGEEGRTIRLTKKDGTVVEHALPEDHGTYLIDDNNNLKKLDESVQWIEDDSEGDKILLNLPDNEGVMIVSKGDKTIELKHIDAEKDVFVIRSDSDMDQEVHVEIIEKDGGEREIRIDQTIIVERIDEKDLEILEKAGAEMTMERKEKLEIDRMKFHPNPSNGQFTLEFKTPETGVTNVEIYNIKGKKIYEDIVRNFDGTYKKDIDISGEKSGTYFLKIQQGNKLSTRKIILE
jgi:hypothetical protein